VHRVADQRAKDLKAVRAFAEAGGRVVVLEQDRSIPAIGVRVPHVQATGGASAAFRTARRDFYAWRGLGDDDRVFRRFNGPVGAVVRRPLDPADGDEVLLIAAQGSTDLNWPVVVRRRVGKGELTFCQMPLHRHLAGARADPVAKTILVNLLGR